MNIYTAALNLLCEHIILGASPTRGKPPHPIRERRSERITHFPDFLPEVATAYARLIAKKLDDHACQKVLEEVLLRALAEAKSRNPYFPSYFELVLEICEAVTPNNTESWFITEMKERSIRPELLSRRIQNVYAAYCQKREHELLLDPVAYD